MAQDIIALPVLSAIVDHTIGIVDHTIGIVKAHICYALYCKTNLRNLEEEVGKLKNEREKLQHSVDEEKRNGKVIEQDVDRWLLEVDEIIECSERELVQDKDRARKKCFVGLCPNFITRYQLGRKVKEELASVTTKLDEKPKGPIAYCAAPPEMGVISPKGYQTMESRKPIFKEVMNALQVADVHMVGVYGMGGIGKTTLVNEIAREAMENKLFDKIVFASVTRTPDIRKLQEEIADQLGLKFDEESERGRANRLHERLKQEKKEKKILFVLDDLWKKLDLEAVGISLKDEQKELKDEQKELKHEQKECKMLLTSRESDVLSTGMDVQKNFQLRNLEEEEAWELFKNTAGGNVENPEVHPVALDIAKKLAGLPVAIVTVAKALKDKSLPQWKDALRDLQKPSPGNFEGVPGAVYGAIELSYSHLESKELRSTFLLCSRMGHNASVEDLLKYAVGLKKLSGIAKIEAARNKVYSLVQKLKNSCLLLDGNTSNQFSIHDLVRDVATSVALRDHDALVKSSNEVELEWSDKDSLKYTEIWLHGNSVGLSKDLKFPMLKVFNMHSEDPSLEVPGHIFGGMQKLKVLGLTNFSSPSLPSSLHLLKNLCSLCLHQSSLGEIAIIGELKNLEILSFVKSTIKHLPREIGELTKLKLLDLSDCSELEVISPNVISSLSLLQELCMGDSFHRWDIGPNNASLVELEHLSHLTNLEIHVPDARVISKDLFSRTLERYRIFIGDVWEWDGVYETSRTLKLQLDERAYHLEQGVLKLLKQTEDLYILELKGVKNVICELDREGFPLLKHLHLHNSREIQYIIDTMDGVPSNISLFPMLESLFLYNLVSLEKIYHGTLRTQSFGKLQSLEVENCNKLKKLFSFSMAQGLSQLQSIKITSCLNMVEVVAEETEESDSRNEGIDAMEFTQLHFISLEYLPHLRKFYSREKTSCVPQTQSKSLIAGVESGEIILNEELRTPMQLFDNKIVFLKLEELVLRLINTDRLWNGQLPAVSIQNLQSLVVTECENLKYIFSSSMVKSLAQLKYLSVGECKSVEEIVVAEEEIMSNMLFPKLEEIELWSLPKLKCFCTGSVIECPLLERLTIHNCSCLETFISGFRGTKFTISNEAPELNSEEKCSNAAQPLFDETGHVATVASESTKVKFEIATTSETKSLPVPDLSPASSSTKAEAVQEMVPFQSPEFSPDHKNAASKARMMPFQRKSAEIDPVTGVKGDVTTVAPESTKVKFEIATISETKSLPVPDLSPASSSTKAEAVREMVPFQSSEFSPDLESETGMDPSVSRGKISKNKLRKKIGTVLETTGKKTLSAFVSRCGLTKEAIEKPRIGNIDETDDIESLVKKLKFSYERLKVYDTKIHRLRACDIQTCFLYCALFAEGVNRSKLVEYWIQEDLLTGNLVDAQKKGRDIIDVLIREALLENSEDGLSIKIHDTVRDLATWILSTKAVDCQFLMRTYPRWTQLQTEGSNLFSEPIKNKEAPEGHQYWYRAGTGLTEPPIGNKWEQAKMIFLMDNDLSSLPERPDCPLLSALFLQRNYCLRVIPVSFFDFMPSLKVLDMSRTRITCLPDSLSQLASLEKLILRDCELLTRLPSGLKELKHLQLLDLHGTGIYQLPKEIGELASLWHLEVSFYGPVDYGEYSMLPSILISDGIISRLLYLTNLSIVVYPGDRRWKKITESIIKEICNFNYLTALRFYFPRVEHLQLFLCNSPSWKGYTLEKFSFIVGHDVKRMLSRVPHDVELDYTQQNRCLRFVNDQRVPDAVVQVLARTTALYLDHHLMIRSLTEFGARTIEGLELCVVRECPEIEIITDSEEITLPSLEYLSLHYLEKLERIWKNTMPAGSFESLKHLRIHACPKLSVIVTSSSCHYIHNLAELFVEDCQGIMEIISDDANVKPGDILLPKLKKLTLHHLPKLVSIWKGAWPSLEYHSIYNCPGLK